MLDLLLVTNPTGSNGPLAQVIQAEGLRYVVGTAPEEMVNGHVESMPDAALLDLDALSLTRARDLVGDCHRLGIPVLAVLSGDMLASYDASLGADDLVIQPIHHGELTLRLKQLVLRTKGSTATEVIQVEELSIDLEKYDVAIAGHRVDLAYKEYQLLVLLASNPGRVYTRDSLLSQIWGYDYFGGTRTVDVHIRRLRAKIEQGGRLYIETIRNVGYRFRASRSRASAIDSP